MNARITGFILNNLIYFIVTSQPLRNPVD